MGMEPFDYLTYKRNKQHAPREVKQEGLTDREKKIIYALCAVAFTVFFLVTMVFIASKTSKIDIEYGRMGKNASENISAEPEEGEEEPAPEERFTIDKRLFLIQQEERGPSESKTVEKAPEQAEVISKDGFHQIKENNREAAGQTRDLPVKKTDENNEKTRTEKTEIKPKIQIPPAAPVTIKPQSALEVQTVPNKVFIGRYYTIEDVRAAQNSLALQGISTFIKKINGQYTLQAGSYKSFDIAKNVAGKLRAYGLDVWIYQ